MDALRLLSCSTGLKLKNGRREQHLQTPSSPGNELIQTRDVWPQGQKRKRGVDEPRVAESRKELFRGARTGTRNETGTRESEITAGDAIPQIPEADRRIILKCHKIKVTDLRAVHQSTKKMSKKAQKEAARIFPQPLTSFGQLRSLYDINRALAENVAEQGYLEPTEVQLASIPLLMRAEEGLEPDLLTIAPTGSGKTLAFLIPLVQKICRGRRPDEQSETERYVSAIIVAPTKELAAQIVNEARKLTARTGVKISAMRKGMRLDGKHEASRPMGGKDDDEDSSAGDEEDQPEKVAATLVKSDILVTTPLLLVNAISIDKSSNTNSLPTTNPLPHITTLILDEADVLLDPLFRCQTLAIWSACISRNLRISLWSATIGSNIESLALDTIKSRQESLSHPTDALSPLLRVVVGLKDSALPPTITHKLTYAATEPGKLLGLRQLIHPPSSLSQPRNKKNKSDNDLSPLRPPFLIFTQTIDRAIALYKELLYDLPTPTDGQSRIAVLHSHLSSTARTDTMTRFRKGSIWVLITTDLLSRGVDFRGVNVVVNYDIPSTAAAYVHRAGRTGRAGREGGVCVTFYTKEDVRYVKNIANVIAGSQKGRTISSASETATPAIPTWLLESLPHVSRKDRADLKQHGVDVRRGVREGEKKDERRKKMKARIGTVSGYDRRKEERKKGAIEGSKRRKAKEANVPGDGEWDEWGGLSD